MDLAHLALDIAHSRHSPFDTDFQKALGKGGIEAVEDLSVFGLKPLKILAALVEGSTEMQREDLEAEDYVRLLARVIRETAGAMKGDQCVVGILDADKYFQQQSLRDALDHIIATLPERAKLVLGLREGDPFLDEYQTLEREQVREPLPLGELARKAAEELIEKHFEEDVSADLVNGLIERCGLLPLALDAGIKLIRQSDKEPVAALADLPGDCRATNLMQQLARAAVDTERPGPDLVRILALARESLSLDELTAVLRSSGREEDAADVERTLRSWAIIDVLERRGNGEARYQPYHDWMRAAILGLTQSPIREPLHQALGEFYWARGEEDKRDERAIRHCTYHLAQGGLVDVEAKQRFLAAVCQTGDIKRIWGLTRDLEEELKLARELVRDKTFDVAAQSRVAIYMQCGFLAADTGNPEEAIVHFECVRDVALEADGLLHEESTEALMGALGNIATAYLQMEDRKKAFQFYEEALEIARHAGHRQVEASCLGNIGSIYLDIGHPRKGLKAYGKALRILQEERDPVGLSDVLGNIGVAYRRLRQPERALEALYKALGIQRTINYRLGEAKQLANIGLVYEDLGEFQEALNHLCQALLIFTEIGAVREIEQTKRIIARIEEKLRGSES